MQYYLFRMCDHIAIIEINAMDKVLCEASKHKP